jgi:hypothetical protein
VLYSGERQAYNEIADFQDGISHGKSRDANLSSVQAVAQLLGLRSELVEV